MARRVKKESTEKKELSLEEKFVLGWSGFLYKIKDEPMVQLSFFHLPDFFKKEVFFELNKIHVIQGENGQGKSTLLTAIGNCASGMLLSQFSDRLIQVSNNHSIGLMLNNVAYSPYRLNDEEKGGFFPSKWNPENSNLQKNLLLYTDFSINFYKEGSNIVPHEILEGLERHSNGERKIAALNDIFQILGVLKNLDNEKIIDTLNIMVILDEPDSGLSMDIQKELVTRFKYYVKRMPDRVNLTVILASHSFVWGAGDLISIHNIQDFKVENKRVHKKVFL